MRTLLNHRSLAFLMLLICGLSVSGSDWQSLETQDTSSYVSPFYIRNERCFKCHGQELYENSDTSMPAGKIIDRKAFYGSNHKSFKCTDCHSEDYSVFPHPGELKDEMHFNCLDCHGGDKKYSHFKFELIEAEYSRSVHFRFEEKGFTCWECHDPHSYKIIRRNSKDIIETIRYDNTICLDCHSDNDRFRYFSNTAVVDISQKHKLLKDPELHFTNVGCTGCHVQANDSLLVPHLVMTKDKAYRDCKGCHSKQPQKMSASLPGDKSKIPGFVILTVTLFLAGTYLVNIILRT